MRRTTGRFSQLCGIMCAVCFIRVSQVMCLLPGLGRGCATELHSDGADFEVQQDRRSRGEGLVSGEDGIMRGQTQ